MTDLVEGETYYFRIKAKNYVGYSEYSSEFSIIAASAPSVPYDIRRIED